MAFSTELMRDPETPLAALQKTFIRQANLLPEHVVFEEIAAPALLGDGDRAWRWTLKEGAPRLHDDSGVVEFTASAGNRVREAPAEERYPLTRGVVVETGLYGGFLVAVDPGENESDASLVECALSLLPSTTGH